jgi:hypothetical protein
MDSIFHRTILELGLSAVCIHENVDSNRYEITYMFPHDLYYLGIQVGLKKSQEIFTK